MPSGRKEYQWFLAFSKFEATCSIFQRGRYNILHSLKPFWNIAHGTSKDIPSPFFKATTRNRFSKKPNDEFPYFVDALKRGYKKHDQASYLATFEAKKDTMKLLFQISRFDSDEIKLIIWEGAESADTVRGLQNYSRRLNCLSQKLNGHFNTVDLKNQPVSPFLNTYLETVASPVEPH